jgi:cobalt-zinc-cadmium efflux system membrane fusion protein
MRFDISFAGAVRAPGIFILLLLAAGCARGEANEAAALLVRDGERVVLPEGSPLRERIRVDTVELAQVRRRVTAPAAVEADPSRFARVLPPAAGRVLGVHVRFGEPVRAGQLLLTLSAPDFAAARAEYQSATSKLQQARRERERKADLKARGIVAARDLEHAELELAEAQSEHERAAAHLRTFDADPARKAASGALQVRSPIGGRVVELAVTAGEYHSAEGEPLLTVADLSTVWLTANVSESEIRHVAAGQPVEAVLTAYPDEPLQGSVLFVGDLLDPETRTVRVRVAFPNPTGRLKPGMFATITFHGAEEAALVVPTTALVQIREQSYVFVETAPATFEQRAVTPGAQRDGRTVIHAGLAPGERIVVRDAVLLQ